ncbi:phosphate ABC transporter substrate-binding protein [Roseomonas eburnea]|uniref:Phosphate ABC transporter substrate-binding protein n=2 Tax=Neoroseomonas eburnea TaxID=1346889 RepID=A0A9X9XK85_9PROT|nr:substrate-binding domain-containing protein [Neoroseomonas eburnea]MBR0684121.1 phosphate ABC transporter substrate-binding protein [Neoroseomonas eburnea]
MVISESRFLTALLLLLATALTVRPEPAAAQRRDAVLATGSSTVAPFTNAVADRLAEGGARRAEVRSVGTVHGFNEFCQGTSLRFADIQDASRRMNFTEFGLCASRGVHEIMELMIGFDGIVVAHRHGLPSPNFTRAQLWLGSAKEIPRDGRLVPNPHRSWRDVSQQLPDWPIRVIGPPPTSGTRDSFTDLVMLAGCQALPEVRAIRDTAQRRRVCTTVREDGGWVDGGEDDEVIVGQVVDGAIGTLGIFGFSFLERNLARIDGATIDGIDDTRENIASGRYPIARPLYIYVKRPNLDLVPGLRAFVQEYVSEAAMGPEGYLIRRGLVGLDDASRARLRQAVADGAIMLRRPGE